MPEYQPGTPSWVELSSPDTDAAAEFYGELMGWSATEPGGEETGGYRMFQQDSKNVAGLMAHMQEGQPTAWATYVSVADAEETAAKVIREKIDHLSTEGHIYSTIDDNHFKSTD